MNVFKKFVVLVLIVMGVIGLASCGTKITKYVVEFANTEFSNNEVEKGSKISRPTDPLRDGYVFDDWYKDEEYQVLFDFNKPIEENTKIYANFYILIKKLLEVGLKLSHGEVSEDKYMVKGKIKSINQMEYGNMIISDGNDEISVYGVYGSNNEKYSELNEKPVVGDIVVLRGPLKKFNDEIELNKSTLIKFEKGEPNIDINLDEYEELTILDARTKNIDHKVIVSGVVAQITYANGKKPNGIYLVDNTNAIYLYDNNIAASVKVGDTIKVAGVRTNFILEDEKSQAARHGYEGAIQLANIVLLEKKELNSSFDETWIQERTIKELMETNPRLENITGSIYRVNAYIKKVPGSGFVNYYFNDLDDETGSYTYSMNNGSDFSWLDEYDGELRTVYLSVINAKSTASGIQYRFVPIKIGDLFEYNKDYNPVYAVKYYGVDQFEKEYTYLYSPDKELITIVTNEKLNINNIKLEYHSSDENVAYFEEINGKTIFKTNNIGKAKITIKGIDGENTFSEIIEIEVKEKSEVNVISIAEAIIKPDDQKVYLEGIVGASLVNKTGFYLIDETGVIAVETTSEELSKIKLGNKVIIEGIKTHVGKSYDKTTNELTAVGQIVVKEALLVVNEGGNHEYSTTSFKTGKTLKDFLNLNKLEDHSTEVYLITAKIVYEETSFYTRYGLEDNEQNRFSLYSSSGKQLSFLDDYRDLEVEIEFTVVNWNGKNYVGSIIAIIVDGNKIVNNSNFK